MYDFLDKHKRAVQVLLAMVMLAFAFFGPLSFPPDGRAHQHVRDDYQVNNLRRTGSAERVGETAGVQSTLGPETCHTNSATCCHRPTPPAQPELLWLVSSSSAINKFSAPREKQASGFSTTKSQQGSAHHGARIVDDDGDFEGQQPRLTILCGHHVVVRPVVRQLGHPAAVGGAQLG